MRSDGEPPPTHLPKAAMFARPPSGAAEPGDGTLKRVERLKVLTTLWLSYALLVMARRPLSVLRAEIQADTGLTTFETSVVDMAFLTAYTAGQLTYGSIKGARSSKSILLMGLGGSAASCALFACSSNVLILAIAWGVHGVAQATGWASCMMLLAPWLMPAVRGKAIGMWATNTAAGGVVGNLLPTVLLRCGLPWRSAFWINAATLATTCLALWPLLVPHPNAVGLLSPQQREAGLTWESLAQSAAARSVEGELLLAAEDFEEGEKQRQLSCVAALRVDGVARMAVAYFMHKFVRYALILWLPFFLAKELSFSTTEAGLVSSALDVGGVAGTLVSGLVADRLHHGNRRTLVSQYFAVGVVLSVLLTAVVSPTFAEHTGLCTALVGTAGFFTFAVDALMNGVILVDFCERRCIPPHQSGAIIAAVGGVGAAGSIVQGVVTSWLATTSWPLVFYTLAITTLLALVVMAPIASDERSWHAHRAQALVALHKDPRLAVIHIGADGPRGKDPPET